MVRDAMDGNWRALAVVLVVALGGGAGGGALLGDRAAALPAAELAELERRLEARLERRIEAARGGLVGELATFRRQLDAESALLRRELVALLGERVPAGLADRLVRIERWIARTDPTWGALEGGGAAAARVSTWRRAAQIRDSP